MVSRIGENRLGGNIVGITGPGGVWHYLTNVARSATCPEETGTFGGSYYQAAQVALDYTAR